MHDRQQFRGILTSIKRDRERPSETIRIDGVRKVPSGPDRDFARVGLVVEAAEGFDVVVTAPPPVAHGAHHARHMEWAIFGFLDVVMLDTPRPVRNIKVTIVESEADPIRSTAMTFRLAGRDAGRKFLERIRVSA